MLHKILPTLILIICLISCKSRSALDFSEAIVKKEKSLVTDIETTERKVADYIKADKFDSVAAVSERMEKLVDNRLQEVKSLPLPDAKNAEGFKKASVEYFEFLKSVYTSYKNFGLAKTEEERLKEQQKLLEIINNKNNIVAVMQREQRKFAEANGFRVQ